MSTSDVENRAKGCLIGGAIGDCLGLPNEFKDFGPKPWDKPITEPITEPIASPAYGGVARGQCSDDSHMAIQMHLSLNAKQEVDEADLVERYRTWVAITFDAGGTTRSALAEAKENSGKVSGLIAWSKSDFKGSGNGSLMRAYPLPVFYRDHAPHYDLIHASIRESATTHADPRCVMAVAVYNVAVHSLLNGKTPEEAWMDAIRALPIARETAGSLLWNAIKDANIPIKYINKIQEAAMLGTKLAFRDLSCDLVEAAADDPKLYGEIDSNMSIVGGYQGFVRVAFRLAFWEMLHANTFEEGVLDIVNRGGDADSSGSVGGSMLGARFGLKNIPAEWVEKLIAADCTTATGTQAKNPIWNSDEYHPRSFLKCGWVDTTANKAI